MLSSILIRQKFYTRTFSVSAQHAHTMPAARYVYAVTAPDQPYVKIGKHTGKLGKLVSRYQTYFGSRLQLHAFPVENHSELEIAIFDKLHNYHVNGELYRKDGLVTYLQIMCDMTACDTPTWITSPRRKDLDECVVEQRKLKNDKRNMFARFACGPPHVA